ncbi:MAG: class I SAM-dependent methyltransferase [Planctomycetota bacterium]
MLDKTRKVIRTWLGLLHDQVANGRDVSTTLQRVCASLEQLVGRLPSAANLEWNGRDDWIQLSNSIESLALAARERQEMLGEEVHNLVVPLQQRLAQAEALNQTLLTAYVQQVAESRMGAGSAVRAHYHVSEKDAFATHYVEWRRKRVDAIVGHYGAEFFPGKRVLELGCGYGDIGAELARLGAEVTCCDSRQEHLDVVRERHPHLRTIRADLDHEWPLSEPVDLVLHMGLLYHLRAPEPSLRRASAWTRALVLESEVCDSTDPRLVINTIESGYDQAYGSHGCRPSTGCIEQILESCGFRFVRLRDASCNSGIHTYDWQELNTGGWRHGLRRMWFAERCELPQLACDRSLEGNRDLPAPQTEGEESP